MRACVGVLLLLCVMMTGCGKARQETATSVKNAEQAAKYLLETDLNESQQKAAHAVMIAVNPAIDLLSRNWLGRKEDVKASVTVTDWRQSADQAKERVIHQAAVAQAAIDDHYDTYAGFESLFWGGVAVLFGSTIAKILQQKAELALQKMATEDAVEFGMDAMNADTPEAKSAVKRAAIQRKQGTKHAKKLDEALIKVRDRRGAMVLDPSPIADKPPVTPSGSVV